MSFVGPSYNLESRPASVQRTINLVPVPLEPGNERTAWAFKDVPGLAEFTELPVDIGDPLWSYVVLLLQGGDLYDWSSYHRVAASASGVTEDVSYWQPAGIPGFLVSDGLVTWAAADELIPGSAEFTFEGWFRTEAETVSNGAYWWVPSSVGIVPTNNVSGQGTLTTMYDGSPNLPGVVIDAGVPYYVAIEREGDNLVYSINGEIIEEQALGPGAAMPATAGPFCFGGRNVTPTIQITCAGLRYTVGINRYGGEAFTPPTIPYLVDA